MAEVGKDIQIAKELLQKNELVAIPTETVYGLGGNALEVNAVAKIFEVKNRPHFDPMIIHTNSLDKISGFVKNIPEIYLKLADYFMPGPLTFLIEKKKSIPDMVTAGSEKVAVRIPNHPLTLQLLETLHFPPSRI